jgi:hypothetical protein
MDAYTTFYAYVNTRVFTQNMTTLMAIRQYLLDNNIPVNYKTINAVTDAIHLIETYSNNRLNELNINYNNNVNVDNNEYTELQNNINYITELHTLMTNNMIIVNNNYNNNYNNHNNNNNNNHIWH